MKVNPNYYKAKYVTRSVHTGSNEHGFETYPEAINAAIEYDCPVNIFEQEFKSNPTAPCDIKQTLVATLNLNK